MKVRDFSRCPRCKAPTIVSVSHTGAESEFWRECTKCNTYINTYVPQAHQEAFHKDNHLTIGNFGAYGSGKTTTSRQEFYKHLFITPKGNTMIGANVASQYEQTIKRDIEGDLPKQFITHYSTQKQYMDFINGHRLMYRPFDDANKLRSYNLTMYVMVEASEIKAEVFTQLKTRLRNMAAAIQDRDENGNLKWEQASNGALIPILKADWRRGIIESNPAAGWIRTDVLLVSDDIQKHGEILDQYIVMENSRDEAISSHVTTCDANQFLPKNFKATLCKNKPQWWINRYVYGSFMYSDGLVYPNAANCVVPAFEIPKHWKRIVSFDYGLSDAAVYIYGAIDEVNNCLYIYREDRNYNKSVEELAQVFKNGTADIPYGGMICPPIIDPKSAPKRDYEKKSLADHFLDYGIAFQPGYVNVDARVFRLNTYIESGKLKIMETCTDLIKELREYKFKTESGSNDAWTGKPEDKNNHGINALEWITMELPSDPNNLVRGVFDKMGRNLEKERIQNDIQMAYSEFALTEPDEIEVEGAGPFDMPDYFY